jgi:ABC-type transport system involved in cytochrome bd biosynthesis fused ATPase/permease subunit
MFRNDEQSARACRALLATVRLERLWTAGGPTERAVEYLDADGGTLSSGERIMLLAAFAFWHGSSPLRLAEIIETLDSEPSEAICSLLLAVKEGAGAVDDWLAERDVPEIH